MTIADKKTPGLVGPTTLPGIRRGAMPGYFRAALPKKMAERYDILEDRLPMNQPPHLSAIAAKRERVEFLARIVAAERANRLEDPTGDHLSPDVWQRCLPEARAIMALIERRP